MKENKNVISIASTHIEAGIKKYEGKPDNQLNNIIKNAGLNYTSYVFNDGRVLLVLPDKVGAFLYKNQDTLFKSLNLE